MATTLLLADDSPTIAKILKMALANEPYEIRSVLTAEEAITELKRAPPYFFLCDLSLPEKNGYEFARLIKRDSKLKQVRVVLLASAFEPVDEVEYQSCGADGLIKKPFDPAELRQSLRNITDAPPIFPAGSHVTGSLSGFMVSDSGTSTSTTTNTGVIPPASLHQPAAPESPPEDTLSNLLSGNQESGDADSILSGLLGGNEEAPPSAPGGFERTVNLDLTDDTNAQNSEEVLDISSAFDLGGGGATAMIDFNAAASDPVLAAPEPEPPLSANAQALAAFFDAEISLSQQDEPPRAPPPAAKAAPAAPPPSPDSFDASLGSIEWDATGGAADASLSGWSSNQPSKAPEAPRKAPAADRPPAFEKSSKTTQGFAPMPISAPRAADPARSGGGAGGGAAGAGGASLMFDTGGASFRFSDDYINRITKAFTGSPEEAVPDSPQAESAEPAFFPQRSDDRPSAPPIAPAAAPLQSPGGGAWSETDVQKIEQIVREEVQMVVREVAEKIAWEVIPELAENLIRKELDRVLKEMGQ